MTSSSTARLIDVDPYVSAVRSLLIRPIRTLRAPSRSTAPWNLGLNHETPHSLSGAGTIGTSGEVIVSSSNFASDILAGGGIIFLGSNNSSARLTANVDIATTTSLTTTKDGSGTLTVIGARTRMPEPRSSSLERYSERTAYRATWARYSGVA